MDRIIRRNQMLELVGISRATQWRMEKAGLFPTRVKVGKWAVGWHLEEVEEWLRVRERVSLPPCEPKLATTNREIAGGAQSAATDQMWKP